MIINYIEFKNYSSFKDFFHIDFNEGITGIIGIYDENIRKSNGSGKTTILNSITYALFGKGEYTKISELINDNNKDDEMFVKLSFVINGIRYLIDRGRKKKDSYLDFYEEDKRRGDSTTTIKKTQDEINSVIGMDYDMFTASVFFEQGNMDKFINADPTDRRNYIDKVLGLKIWRDAAKKALSLLTKLKQELENKSEKEKSVEIEINNLKESLLEKKNIIQKLDKATVEKKELEEKIKVIHDNSLINTELDNLITNKQIYDDNNKDLDTSIANNKKIIDENKTNITEYSKKLEDIEKEQKNIYNLKTELEEKIEKVNIEINENTNILNNNTSKLNLASFEYKSLIDNISNIKAGKCDLCKQDITDEYVRSINDKYNNKIKEYEQAINNLKTEKNSVGKHLDDLNVKNVQFKKEYNIITEKITNFVNDITKLNYNIKNYEEQNIITQKYIDDAFAKKEKIFEEIDKISKKIVDLQQKVVYYNNTDLKSVEDKLNAVINDISNLNMHIGVLKEKEETLDNKNVIAMNLKKEISDLSLKIIYYEEVLQAFKDIPTILFSESISDIETIANNIINQILPIMEVSIYEDLSKKTRPIIIDFVMDGKNRSYKRLSGGEKTVANIGLRLGFSQVISAKAKTVIDFIGMDEPFGALDEENKDLIKKILTVMLAWFQQIIVISHDESIKDFPNLITVRKDLDNNSYI